MQILSQIFAGSSRWKVQCCRSLHMVDHLVNLAGFAQLAAAVQAAIAADRWRDTI